ncbi:helix-turn-helix transcriptional regulator [Pseudogemmobacter bohemicus]|uniref:helix-turn-helix transcriptional regulator n=1 Tax=Pseudogemmobacter bohemicus TaxID=2250708 RepID=UPI0018E57C4B|nr:DNA-binding protein [Pseudogemmobacter bohemicus]
MKELGKSVENVAEISDQPLLDRWRVDEILEPNRPIWGLDNIARVLGLSRDTVRKLAKMPGVPIYQPEGAGSYFAFRSELLDWLKSKRTNENQRLSTVCHLHSPGLDAA